MLKLVAALAGALLLVSSGPAAAQDDTAGILVEAAVNAANPLIAEVQVALARAARVFVEYDNPQAGRYRTPRTEPGAEHVVTLARLRPQTTYDYTIFVDGPVAAGRFTTGRLPPALAAMPVKVSGRSSQPLILSDYRSGPDDSYLIFQDETGGIVWFHAEVDQQIFAQRRRISLQHRLPGPHHFAGDTPDPDQRVPPSRTSSGAYRLSNGNTLVNFGSRQDPGQPLLMVEVDPAGNEVFRFENLSWLATERRLGRESDSFPHRRYRASGGIDSIMGETMLRPPAHAPVPPYPATVGAGFIAAVAPARVRELEAAMDGAERVTGGPFDLYLTADRRLVYRKQPCAPGDAGERFFLHVIPVDPDDLPAGHRAHGFYNRSFRFMDYELRWQGACLAAVPLPDYPIDHLRTGQFTPDGQLWQAELRAAAGAFAADGGQPEEEEDAGGHPADPWFALERVLDVAVEMAPADWDRLRRQQLNWEEEGLVGADCLGQPFPSVFSWFAADVTVSGQRYGNVGVRKKGFRGSSSEEKPSLKLAFDRFVDGQALGGALRRITLNNSVPDPSLLSTCLAYQVFAAAGLPAPRCNYAAVTVNGEDLGLYVHVEDIERSLLERAFADARGNLYEGTYSDFRPEFRGTFEKKTNEDADDWTDVDAVVAALEDPSPAGLEALAAAVDLDRFLTFWAAEVLVRHRTGYAGNRKNFWVYREPDGRFVFIPWDTDSTFLLDAAEVIALGAIAHRLYGDAAWRAAFLQRLRELLDTVWNETELLRRLERMAAIVRAHALPGEQANAARGADSVRRFIDERRGRLLVMAAAPPPRPPVRIPKCAGTAFELRFRTTWGSRDRADPFTAGTVTVNLNGADQAVGPAGATAGWAGPQDDALPGLKEVRGVITVMTKAPDSSIHGVTYWRAPHRFVDGAHWSMVGDRHAGWKGLGVGAIKWSLPPGATGPERVFPIFVAGIDLDEAGTEPGAAVSGLLYGRTFGPILGIAEPKIAEEPGAGLIINEVAARGQPRDWFELYNASGAPLALAGFVFADDLTDRGRRTSFPPGLSIAPGAYLRIELDADGWPGFALGRDEELGIWRTDGELAAQVDWRDGDSDRGMSYARVPDVTGPFRTVIDPTPGAPNARPAGE